MGAYLSQPVTDKERFEGSGNDLQFGGSAMQGWRRTMEDAHIAEVGTNGDPDCAIFGVFDGHGGAEVAKFCQKYLTQEIKKTREFDSGAVQDSLVQVFHRMDDMLRDHQYADELEQLKTKEPDEEEEEVKEEGDGVSPMDALEMLKRVFQLKRFMGENGQQQQGQPAADSTGGGSSSSAGASSGSDADAAASGSSGPEAAMDSDDPPATAAPAAASSADPSDPSRVQAGCTAVVAVKKGLDLFVANAGDSRGVLCRAGKAVALSEDHKPAQEGERKRILNAGGFLSEIGGVCRVNGNLNLSRAIGDLKYKTNAELPAKDQIISAQPDVRHVSLTPDDSFFLLACDGVWDVMTNQEAIDFVHQRLSAGMKPTDVSCALLDACLATDPKEARGVGCDNMTVVVVQLTGSKDSNRPSS